MTSSTYLIAGHYFTVQGGATAQLLLSLYGFPVFRCHTAQQEWIVQTDCTLPPASGKLLNAVRNEELDEQYEYHYTESLHHRYTIISSQGYRCEIDYPGSGNTVCLSSTQDPNTLRYALWIAYTFLALPQGIVPIHASAIVHQQLAVLFLGESGTGKSTHTTLWQQHIPHSRLLNDDSPMLSLEGDTPLVYGSPWSGKTHCYHNIAFPLRAIVRLSQAPHNKIRPLSFLDAFVALQPSCPPAFVHQEHYTDLLLQHIQTVLQSTPAYHLACLPNAAAAQLSHSTLFPEL